MREKPKVKIISEFPEYNAQRGKLVYLIGKINSVANPEGKGRDDLTLDILLATESLSRRVHQS